MQKPFGSHNKTGATISASQQNLISESCIILIAVVKWSWKNCLYIIRCHEAILIYTLVEVDAERQINEKTEFVVY